MNGPRDDSTSRASSVVSVVVTYQPDEAVVENVRRLAEQCAQVIIVDNASSGCSAQWVAEAARLPRTSLIQNPANLGIASALNTGIRKALEGNHPWIATFDQDTRIPDEFFRKLIATHDQCAEFRDVGMVVPGGWVESGSSVAEKEGVPSGWSFVRAALNSGNVLKADVFEKVGLYDDGLFIDYVDVDFCLRLQKHGLKILSADSVALEHELGHKQTRNIFGRRISFRIHAAWRYYYIFRNRIVVFRRFIGAFPKWVLRDGFWMCLELGRIVFLEHGRRQKVRAALYGIKDGLLGRTGRHPSYPAQPA